MYCPYCGTKLPEAEQSSRKPLDGGSHLLLRSLICPNSDCEAAIQVDDRRGVVPLTAPIITILIVYRD